MQSRRNQKPIFQLRSVYSRPGGAIFTMLVDNRACPQEKYIASPIPYGVVLNDSNEDHKFLELINRGKEAGASPRSRGSLFILPKDLVISTKNLWNADGYTIKFNPSDYDKVVKGFLLMDQMVFNQPPLVNRNRSYHSNIDGSSL